MPELTTRKAQLDSTERKHLESIVTQLRTRAEKDARYWIEVYFALKKEGAEVPSTLTDKEQALRQRLHEAIAREQAGGRSWTKARKLYIKGVGYTLVNRLAALRCMEVRGFLDRAVTRFRADGRTPAADPLIDAYFLAQGEGIWMAFLQACHKQAQEIEILFDLSDPYSLLMGDLADWDGDVDTAESWSTALLDAHVELLQDAGKLLDAVDDAVWRADDVLGWVYEYYNVPDLDAVRKKARGKGLDPEDVPVANQFYTPHWVVRMLTDNSLGKLFLEHEGTLQQTIQNQAARFTPEERKSRDASTAASIEELCAYLVPTDEEGEATDFEHPREIRVFDPACGSGHFLLYAFDVLERIWWKMAPDVPRSEVPTMILQHNLFGVDLDLRACQLAAFNLYLKARTRVETHGGEDFEMPSVGIICADAHVADLDRSHQLFDEVSAGDEKLRDALGSILRAFEQVEGLGSLLDVKGTLVELVDDVDGQMDIFEDADTITLPQLLGRLHETVAEHTSGASFRAKDLRSFLRLLVVLSQDYDVALMNPPYGARERMPKAVRKYVKENYEYTPEFYINFFEIGERLSKKGGRVGMLVPHSFMFRKSFQAFREDFVGERGAFDFLAEFGYDILDNAMVGTVGTVVQVGGAPNKDGGFIRLHDLPKDRKEPVFLKSIFSSTKSDIKRFFRVKNASFGIVPRTPLCYSLPAEVREIHRERRKLDPSAASIEGKKVGTAAKGMDTNDNDRFIRFFWETRSLTGFVPYAKGGSDAWIMPQVVWNLEWNQEGKDLSRAGALLKNKDHFGKEGLTWTYVKRTGRRFGYFPRNGAFDGTGSMLFLEGESPWSTMGILNSDLYHSLFLSLTLERHWLVGHVGRIPWPRKIENISGVEESAKNQFEVVLSGAVKDPQSPYYMAPALLPQSKVDGWFYPDHVFTDEVPDGCSIEFVSGDTSLSLRELAEREEKAVARRKRDLERLASQINDSVYDAFSIEEETRKTILQEIFLRTSEDPEDREVADPGEVALIDNTLRHHVKRLLLHLAFEILEEDDDGIVLLGKESDDEEADLVAKMIDKFEAIWGEYAADRLQEVDDILGRREATDEAYPNLRYWLQNKLFAFHCSEFENTPILWQLNTDRLVSGPKGQGLSCIVDYHQLGPDFFDRLTVRYVEPRKAVLRERRRAANSTSGDPAASAAVRSRAREAVERYDDALRQIDGLEAALRELSQSTPRPWAHEVQPLANETTPKVRHFRKRLEERLKTLDRLHEVASTGWFKDQFSNKFMESVNGNREEWIDALKDLEAACEQFAQPATEPVEAHLYDLLPYFDKLVGSTHYSSNGIFFLNYYFSKGKKLAAKMAGKDESEFTEQQRLVAALARETDKDVALGKEINAACKEMAKPMDAEWKARALEEVMTAGYRPVKKHGVAINITPLAEKKLVPKIVEDKVL